MLSPILQKLQETLDNPGFYRALTPEEQAELFLTLFAPKPKLFKKPKVIQGIDGKTPVADRDYLSKESAQSLITELSQNTRAELENIISTRLSSVQNGKDAVITHELIETIADLAQSMIVLPDFSTLLTMEPEAIRNSLELLQDGEKLAQSAIEGLEKDLEELRNKPPQIISGGGISKNAVLKLIEDNTPTSDSTPTFETVSKNLKAFPNTLNYTGENLTSIVYTTDLGTVTKTLAYTGDNLTSITLSGDLPSGVVETVKTLGYTGENLTSITYA